MAIEVVLTCPLGSQCETIKDNKIHRCRWYKCVAGQDPTTGELINDWDCSIAWLPLLQIEMANTNRGQTAAIESFRNESVGQQQTFNNIMAHAVTERTKLLDK